MNPADREAMNREADELVKKIKPILATGHDPAAIGAALTELLALWIAGHPAAIRSEVFDMQVDAIRKLYPVAAKYFWNKRTPRVGRRRLSPRAKV